MIEGPYRYREKPDTLFQQGRFYEAFSSIVERGNFDGIILGQGPLRWFNATMRLLNILTFRIGMERNTQFVFKMYPNVRLRVWSIKGERIFSKGKKRPMIGGVFAGSIGKLGVVEVGRVWRDDIVTLHIETDNRVLRMHRFPLYDSGQNSTPYFTYLASTMKDQKDDYSFISILKAE